MSEKDIWQRYAEAVERSDGLAAELAKLRAIHDELELESVEFARQLASTLGDYEALVAELADSRLIAREQEDAHVAANMRNTHLQERIRDLEAALESIAAPGEKSVRLMEQAARRVLGYESETPAECIHKWIGLASGGFRCTQCDAELENSL